MTIESITKFETKVVVKARKMDLVEKFGRPKVRVLKVWIDGNQIHEERGPLQDTIHLLENIHAIVPAVEWKIEEEDSENADQIVVDGVHLAVVNNLDGESSTVYVNSWYTSIEEHSERIDKVKAELLKRGFEVEGASCQVTLVRSC